MTPEPIPYLGHDLWIWVFNRVSPLHGDHVSPNLHFSAHEAATGLSCRLVVFILQEAETPILLLVVGLVVQYDII